MKLLLVLSIIIVPGVMLYLARKNKQVKTAFNGLAVVSTIIFGSIASTAIYQVIADNTVFMTTIHALFLNKVFIISGAYMGLFIIYRLVILTLEEK